MPGPILSMVAESSDELAVFESCEDVQEAWASRNGNYDDGDHFEECHNQHFEIECRTTYTNGGTGVVDGEEEEYEAKKEGEVLVTTKVVKEELVVRDERVVESRKRALLKENLPEGVPACLQEDLEDMECDEDEDEVMEDAVEAINTSVVEAKINLDVSGALTRRKIGSLQMGRTLSYADKDDAEEPPTRRPRPFAHARDSIEFGSPDLRGSSLGEEQRFPGGSRRAVRVVRNPSYQAAMRGPSTLAPPQVTPPPSPGQQTPSSSCEGSPVREGSPVTIRERSPSPSLSGNNNNNNDAASDVSGSSKRSALERAPTAQHAANMPRSASFSGSEAPIPDALGSGSLSQGNSRAGSVSPLPSPIPRRNGEDQPSTPVRGSVITRSFRKLFSTPTRTPPPPTVTTTAPPEDYWLDVADADSPEPVRVAFVVAPPPHQLLALPPPLHALQDEQLLHRVQRPVRRQRHRPVRGLPPAGRVRGPAQAVHLLGLPDHHGAAPPPVPEGPPHLQHLPRLAQAGVPRVPTALRRKHQPDDGTGETPVGRPLRSR
ncbi:serine/arginine-rich splicing factor SR45-like [Penaeus chinensis]|uniref:serine/arginine-rich splicing factor SR45-like n=1 Tax=Penaeus chinensis TaxID=139456 RepID=UPI001FB79FAB|nr:serine/arginine-rich splicing factor SR45-like [Penaeus chinensis]